MEVETFQKRRKKKGAKQQGNNDASISVNQKPRYIELRAVWL